MTTRSDVLQEIWVKRAMMRRSLDCDDITIAIYDHYAETMPDGDAPIMRAFADARRTQPDLMDRLRSELDELPGCGVFYPAETFLRIVLKIPSLAQTKH